jgi:putative ABC transport system ATP-binding protein
MTTTAINLKQCQFSYDKNGKKVINIDQLEINVGEKVFLYGPSGHGKSTLLNLTAGVLKASAGVVEVFGKDLTKISQSKRDHLRGEKIGYIFQIFNLIPYLTVKENITLPCVINKNRTKEDYNLQAEELIDSLGMREHINKKVTDLSIGQQQRVACARALIGNPQMIIADEPTSALDEKNTREFMELLMREWEKRKFTLIFVSHDERLKSYFSRAISLPEINHHD